MSLFAAYKVCWRTLAALAIQVFTLSLNWAIFLISYLYDTAGEKRREENEQKRLEGSKEDVALHLFVHLCNFLISSDFLSLSKLRCKREKIYLTFWTLHKANGKKWMQGGLMEMMYSRLSLRDDLSSKLFFTVFTRWKLTFSKSFYSSVLVKKALRVV